MTIKEVEERTGLARSNIRFYEKEGLIAPSRNENNGYREYTEKNVGDIRKIAYLRTLGISVEEIRKVIRKEATLYGVIEKQKKILEEQLSELQNARRMCENMLYEKIDYDNMDVAKYVADVKEYWNDNKAVFRLDSVSFIYLWGGTIVWGIIMLAALLTAAGSVWYLPAQIPVQWRDGITSSLMDRRFIFVYPVLCVLFRFLLRPRIDRWLKQNAIYSDSVTNYVTNCLCFITLSVEIFTILFVKGIVRNVTALLLADTIVLLGVLVAGWKKLSGKK